MNRRKGTGVPWARHPFRIDHWTVSAEARRARVMTAQRGASAKRGGTLGEPPLGPEPLGGGVTRRVSACHRTEPCAPVASKNAAHVIPKPCPLRVQHEGKARSNSRSRSSLETPVPHRQGQEHFSPHGRGNGEPCPPAHCAIPGDDLVECHAEPKGPLVAVDERRCSVVLLAGRLRRIQRL